MKERFDRELGTLGSGGLGKEEGRRVFLLCAVGLLSFTLTLVSFFTWREGASEGEIAQTASRIEEFFSENEAVSVFFGWEAEDGDGAP